MSKNTFDSFTQRFRSRQADPPAPARLAEPTRSPVQSAGGKTPYEAFGTKDKLLRFEVRRANGLAHSMAYTYLVNFSYARSDYGALFFACGGIAVEVTGRNLRPIVDAMKLHTCEFIEEWNAAAFDAPADDTPLVERITVELFKNDTAKKEG